MKRLLHIILYMALAVHASAQVKVTGRVIDLQNKPVSDVIVKLVSGSKTQAFTSSNAKGEYAIEMKSAPTGEVTLQFSHISYEKESERLSLKERVTKLDMILTPKNISLKEVTVKPDPLRQRGDTLSHNLASFLGKGDVTLEDGLKRLPGVDVSQNGGISYMGKPISQFNIEGLDLLGGKYNLATRNIPADYVTQVEIVRNHHSRRVEKDVPSNEVSMNIKLSNKAKFKPFGQEEAGAGIAPHSAPEGATNVMPTVNKGIEVPSGTVEGASTPVRLLYKPFSIEDINQKMAEMLRPAGMQAPVEFVFQTIEGLHAACPGHPGDWYFTGRYPTPGGNKLVNKAFLKYIEDRFCY